MNFLKSPPKRILIINTFGIGDVLFTTPFITNLKKVYPNAQIDYVANRRTKTVLHNNPHITHVYVYERDEYKAVLEKSWFAYLKKVISFLSEIRRAKYDLLFDFSLNTSIGFMALLTGVPHRVGFNFKNRGKFLNHTVKLDENGYYQKHMVGYYMDLLRRFGSKTNYEPMRLYLAAEDTAFAEHFWEENGLKPDDLVIGIVPGGGASWGRDAHLKRWSAEKYAKLADNLIEKHRAVIILMGDKTEEVLCREVADLMGHTPISACGKTNIHQFGALAQKCQLVVLNDGGPLHMAVASGARTVSIFGPVDDKVYGPYPRKGHSVVRKKLDDVTIYTGFRLKEGSAPSSLAQTNVDEVYKQIEQALIDKR